MSKQGLTNNAQHIAGMALGRALRFLGLRYSKAHRGSRWFSTVAANLAAEGVKQAFLPYR